MAGFFECCRYCVPPKRNPYCHIPGNCKEHDEAKAKHDKCKAIEDDKKRIKNGCRSQRDESVRKAMKKRAK